MEPDQAVLVLGDAGGGVGTCHFFTATSALFPARTNTTCRNQGGPGLEHTWLFNHFPLLSLPTMIEVPVVTFSELIHYPCKSTTATYLPSIHGDWVAKVLYCPYMELCMSCSNDSGCSLHFTDRHGRREGSVMTVRKGISTFDYSKELNVIGEQFEGPKYYCIASSTIDMDHEYFI